MARLLGVEHANLDALAVAAPARARGLTLRPYFDGERTPNRPDATGTLTNLCPNARRDDVARAAIEGVVCGLLDALDALRAVGVPTPLDGAGAGGRGRLVLVGDGRCRRRTDRSRRTWPVCRYTSRRTPSSSPGRVRAGRRGTAPGPPAGVMDARAGPPATIVEPEPSDHARAEAIRTACAAAGG